MSLLTVFIIFPTNYNIFVNFFCENNSHPKILKVPMKVVKSATEAKMR